MVLIINVILLLYTRIIHDVVERNLLDVRMYLTAEQTISEKCRNILFGKISSSSSSSSSLPLLHYCPAIDVYLCEIRPRPPPPSRTSPPCVPPSLTSAPRPPPPHSPRTGTDVFEVVAAAKHSGRGSRRWRGGEWRAVEYRGRGERRCTYRGRGAEGWSARRGRVTTRR